MISLRSLGNIDRKIIFAALFLSVSIPLIFDFRLPNRITKEVRAVYDFIDRLPPESAVLVSFDHDTATLPEMSPMARALLRHLFNRRLRVIGLALRAEGSSIGNGLVHAVAAEYNLQEGMDYVFLGFRPEITSAILGMGENIARVFPKDFRGVPLDEIPLMQTVKNYRQIELIISIADDDTPNYWINYANARYHEAVVPAVTAVMATTYYPFLQEKQIIGMVPGLKAAAEYEQLIGRPGDASVGMSAQSIAHLLILLLILIGNLSYLSARRRR